MVLLGTPLDLGRVLALRQPVVRVHYEIEEAGRPGFDEILGNLRTKGIKVFTIRVKEGNEELLRNCATEPNMYYDVPAVSEMMAVFKSISRSISKLRIAK